MNNYDVGSGGIQMIRSTIALPPTMVRFAWAWLPARGSRHGHARLHSFLLCPSRPRVSYALCRWWWSVGLCGGMELVMVSFALFCEK